MARGTVRAAAGGAVEGPWALPEGWRWERLGDVASTIGGGRLKLNKSHYASTGYPAFSAAGQDGLVGRYEFEGAAVVLSSIGARCGKSFFASGRWSSLANTQCIFPDESLDARYLWYYTNNEERWERSGSAQPFIKPATIKELKLPLPNLNVQHAIVARIDELFTEIDDGEAALARARSDLATWRKALLKAAVTGELTAGWRAANPPAETGGALLARILADRRARWLAEPRNRGKRYAEPVAPILPPDLPDLPNSWAWAAVGQIGDVVTGGTPPTSDVANHTGDIPFFTPGDLDAGFWLSSTRRNISAKGLLTIRPIPAKSVLVTCIGATIGKVGFNAKAGATNQQINTLIPYISSLASYLFYYFDGPGRYRVVDGASSTTIPILNKGDFSRLPVPLPPENEAWEIANRINVQNEEADEAARGMVDCKASAATLRQSILAAAFRGHLAA